MLLNTMIFLILWLTFTDATYYGLSSTSLDWWQKTIIYQIYPRSFQDTNDDGIGDLKGIIKRVSYFKETGIETIWLSPIYLSPQRDLGYDISNYTEIDPIFGTMEDLEELLEKYHSQGIKVILDFVPNHTSDQHPWFEKSVKKIDPYTDYYVWKNPKGWLDNNTPIPPNNWRSTLNDSAWNFIWERKQFYLSQFLKEQPDLNYRCKYVVEEMKNVLRFYLNKGVNGFRADAVPYLVEDGRFLDERPVKVLVPGTKKTDYVNQQHEYTMNQPETYAVLREFREVLDSYAQKGGLTRVLITEAYTDMTHLIEYYGTSEKPIAHMPFNFNLLGLNDFSNATAFDDAINSFLSNLPAGKWPDWVIGNHDNPRVTTRFEPSAVDEINILVQLLPGTPFTYQGEEIGMEDTKLRQDQIVDRVKPPRDPERSPFQWNSSPNAGFSNTKGKTWTPVNPNYYELNLEAQKNNSKSHYKVYKSLAKLRSTKAFQYGNFKSYVVSKWVFAFTRGLFGKEIYVIILNLNNEQEYVNLNVIIPNLSRKLKVRIASVNSEYSSGDEISAQFFRMTPKSAIVLQ